MNDATFILSTYSDQYDPYSLKNFTLEKIFHQTVTGLPLAFNYIKLRVQAYSAIMQTGCNNFFQTKSLTANNSCAVDSTLLFGPAFFLAHKLLHRATPRSRAQRLQNTALVSMVSLYYLTLLVSGTQTLKDQRLLYEEQSVLVNAAQLGCIIHLLPFLGLL